MGTRYWRPSALVGQNPRARRPITPSNDPSRTCSEPAIVAPDQKTAAAWSKPVIGFWRDHREAVFLYSGNAHGGLSFRFRLATKRGRSLLDVSCGRCGGICRQWPMRSQREEACAWGEPSLNLTFRWWRRPAVVPAPHRVRR